MNQSPSINAQITGLQFATVSTLSSKMQPCSMLDCIKEECVRVNVLEHKFDVTILTDVPERSLKMRGCDMDFITEDLGLIQARMIRGSSVDLDGEGEFSLSRGQDDVVCSFLQMDSESDRLMFEVTGNNLKYLTILGLAHQWMEEQQSSQLSTRIQDRCNRSYGRTLVEYLHLDDVYFRTNRYRNLSVEVQQIHRDATNESPEDLALIEARVAKMKAAKKAEQVAVATQKLKIAAEKAREYTSAGCSNDTVFVALAARASSLEETNKKAANEACAAFKKAHRDLLKVIDSL